MLKPGIYERVINELLQEELAEKSDDQKYTQKIDEAEASEVLSRYIYEIVHDTLDSFRVSNYLSIFNAHIIHFSILFKD